MKRAIILAGGLGTRLKPFSTVIPKPLVPIDDKPILEIVINQLRKHGFNHFTLAVNHKADLIKAYFGDGKKYDVKIDYTYEKQKLGTMGPLNLIKDLPDDFLVMNGDVITDLDFTDFYNFHLKNKGIFSICSTARESFIDYGVLEVRDSALTKMIEKPIFKHTVSMGIYCTNKKILQYIPEEKLFGFDDLMHALIRQKINPYVFNHKGKWLDIGRPEDYEKACNLLGTNN